MTSLTSLLWPILVVLVLTEFLTLASSSHVKEVTIFTTGSATEYYEISLLACLINLWVRFILNVCACVLS
jgi:hypothetical protein